jgi:hypothetical protein
MNFILGIFGIGGTKKTTDTTNKYDPQSMSNFHLLNASGTSVMQDYMKDPLKASYFQNQVGMMNRFSQQVGARGLNALLGRGMLGGGGAMPGWMNSNIARIGRSTGAMQSQNVLTALMNAEQRRSQAAGQALNNRPLQTGATQTEQTSGLGTWLPQVIGMGAQAALAFGTGGASMGASMAAKAGSAGIAGGMAGANAFFNRGSNGYTPQGYTGYDNRNIA